MIPRTEQVKMLRRHLTEEPCTLRLFINDVTPRRTDDTPERYTEPTGNGYTPIDLDPERWSFTSLEEGPVVAAYPEQVFTFDGPELPVFGFLIVSASGTVKMVERVPDDAFPIERMGDQVAIAPRLRLEQTL